MNTANRDKFKINGFPISYSKKLNKWIVCANDTIKFIGKLVDAKNYCKLNVYKL